MSEGIAKGMCFRKKRYPSQIKAACALGRITVLFPDKPQRSYECPVCLGWHLTTNPRREDEMPKMR